MSASMLDTDIAVALSEGEIKESSKDVQTAQHQLQYCEGLTFIDNFNNEPFAAEELNILKNALKSPPSQQSAPERQPFKTNTCCPAKKQAFSSENISFLQRFRSADNLNSSCLVPVLTGISQDCSETVMVPVYGERQTGVLFDCSTLQGESKTEVGYTTKTHLPGFNIRYQNDYGSQRSLKSKTGYKSSSKLVVRVSLAVTLASFVFGLAIANFNTCVHHVERELGWCPVGVSDCATGDALRAAATSAIYAGCWSLCAGELLKTSRRNCFLLFTVLSIIACLTTAIASSFVTILWGRFLTGVACGALVCTATVILGEISPSVSRGFYGSLHQVAVCVGIFVSVVFGNALSPLPPSGGDISLHDKLWWRCMIIFPIFPAIVLIYLFKYVYTFDTPEHLWRHGKRKEAILLLERLNGDPGAAAEAAAILEKAALAAQHAEEQGISLCKILQHPNYRRALTVGCLIAVFHQLTGINVLNAASNKMFEEAHLTDSVATLMSTLLMALHVIFALPSLCLTDSFGRRPVLLGGLVGMTLSVFIAAIGAYLDSKNSCSTWLVVIGILSFIVFYSGTYGAVAWIYVSEMYPLEIKGTAAGITNATHWFSALIAVFLGQLLPECVTFTIFTVSGILAFIVLFIIMKETKSRDVNNSPYLED